MLLLLMCVSIRSLLQCARKPFYFSTLLLADILIFMSHTQAYIKQLTFFRKFYFTFTYAGSTLSKCGSQRLFVAVFDSGIYAESKMIILLIIYTYFNFLISLQLMHTALLASQTVEIVLSIQLLHRCHKDMQSLLEPLYTTTDTVTISQKNWGLPINC